MNASSTRFVFAAALLASIAACRTPPTQIVLVVDTNLSKVDLDEVNISVTAPAPVAVDGAAPPDAAADWSYPIPLTTPGAPTFPLTLGIEPSGAPGSLQVSVQGLLMGNLVVEQSAITAFVAGQQKVLVIQLLDTCIGTPCQPAVTDGSSLPPWTGAPPPRPLPSPAVSIGGRTIWANGWHSCANEGSVLYCWGENSDGQIGDGTTRNAVSRVPVKNLKDLAAVGLGQRFSCACDQSGKAYCWGRNVEGQLGIGAASAGSPTPVAVPGIDDCIQIAGGQYHACVVHGADNSVSCWGGNTDGQVGQPASAGTTCSVNKSAAVPCFTSPILVPGLTNVTEVHAGERYTCARKSDSTVWCWGDNNEGTLGDGTNTSRSTPVQVVNLDKDVAEVATGRWFACARHAGGTVSCWGANGSGQLGAGTTTSTNRPVAVVGITDATQIGGGQNHACVLHASGTVSCWGDNTKGQLGNGTTTASLTPVSPVRLPPVKSLAVGSIHTCARTAAGPAFCWGENLVNEIGDGTTTNRTVPVNVAGFN